MKICGGLFDVAKKEKIVAELEEQMSTADFWDDIEEAQKVAQKLTGLKSSNDVYYKFLARLDEAVLLHQLNLEEPDESIEKELQVELKSLKVDLEHLELSLLLSGEYDKNNAIITLHAGAGGTEAQDWAEMLFRMYGRYAERNGYTLEILDYQAGDEAGVKSVTLQISGHNAYGYLRAEKGVHRLVRISPFDSNSRRHTSFAALDVMPEIDEDVPIKINTTDLKVDTYRASGAGGQHINKTDSAVRMTHLPTGIIVQCQNERSQIKNRERCMKLLRAKLFELEQLKRENLKNEIAGDYQAIEWGSQIRSYVFHPYSMVKDHRTGAETGNVQAVMDGDLDIFIEAYLKANIKNNI